MTPAKRFALVVSVIGLVAVVGGARSAFQHERVAPTGFAVEVDLSPIENLAVHSEGRVKSFSSFANSIIDNIVGPKRYRGQSPAHTYIDLMLRPEAYVDADVVYIKNKPLRKEIVDALEGMSRPPDDLGPRLDTFLESGLISEALLSQPKVAVRLERLGSDLIKWGKFVQMVENALGWKDARVLSENLRAVPPPPGGGESWSSVLDLDRPSLLSRGQPAADGVLATPALDPARLKALSGSWNAFTGAWKRQDSAAVNAAAVAVAAGLRDVNPAVYPDENRLGWESFYFRSYNLTWIWMVYLLAVIPLLLSLVYRWRGARVAGLLMFLLAFGLHTWALGLRWYVSGRWPNSNMFEAVTTSAWFGGVAVLVLLPWARGVLGSLFLLTSAVSSMVALMCAYYLPVQLNPNISNMMPVLHDVWLYIHTNIIIWSYVLIFMAAVSAVLYLLWRACGGGAAYVKLGGAGMLAMGRGSAGAGQGDPTQGPALAKAQRGGGATAGAIGASPESTQASAGSPDQLGAVFDGVTMVLMELSFVMLWAGLVMGAIWADHSWGRPWGWDPKEVFALNTFLVFAVLVHARFKVRDKGLWTAWLALIGAGVMLFNWVIINFVITGLHSYA